MQPETASGIEQWKTELILQIARRKGFYSHELEDAYQQLMLVVINFEYDDTHSSGATERTVLTTLIENQLNMILRSKCRRKRHDQKIRRVCGPSQYQAKTCDAHIQHERIFEIRVDIWDIVDRMPALERSICQALSIGTPCSRIAVDLGISRHALARIVNCIREQFSSLGLESI